MSTEPYEVVLVRDGTNDDAWLEARHDGISGSDVLACMGLDPRKQPAHVWLEKVRRERIDGAENEAMVMGRILEPAVKAAFTWKTGIAVRDATELLRSTRWPWMLATPDGWIDPDEIFEAKTTGFHMRDEWAQGSVPERAAAQTMHYLAVTGRKGAHVAVLINNRVEIRYIPRDEALIEMIVEAERAFWQTVTEGAMPDLVPGMDTPVLLETLWPNQTGQREITDTELATVDAYNAANSEFLRWKKRRDELGDSVRILAQGAEEITWGGSIVASIRTSVRNSIDLKKLRDSYPSVADDCTYPNPVRTLRIPRKGSR